MGLGLPRDRRDRLQAVKKEIADLRIQFEQNMNEKVF